MLNSVSLHHAIAYTHRCQHFIMVCPFDDNFRYIFSIKYTFMQRGVPHTLCKISMYLNLSQFKPVITLSNTTWKKQFRPVYIWLEITTPKTEGFLSGFFHLPPCFSNHSEQDLMVSFGDMVEYLSSERRETLMVGDFNCDFSAKLSRIETQYVNNSNITYLIATHFTH